VTGFGLTGHALEMAVGSGVALAIRTSALPLLPNAVELCGRGFTCGGTRSNRGYTGLSVRYAAGMDEAVIGLLNDPQTSGGLLFAVPADRCAEACAAALAHGALCAVEIGEVRTHAGDEPALDFTA
jgi:selenide,water dikinase